MKLTTDSHVEPQFTIDTTGGHVEHGEAVAHDYWIEHCEGATVDESSLGLAQDIMESFVELPREDATEYTYGVIRGLLRKSRKPVGSPASAEGAAQ
ncbi:MAG: hypothetical protein WBC18_14640 [Ottowia sp.]|uniref:hypothetical protein n=1 Tax=Ottowia sp. TaxID=1898956 RepID=UPI003C747252